MTRLLAPLLAAALLLGACTSDDVDDPIDVPTVAAFDRRIPTMDRIHPLLDLDRGWSVEAVDPLVGVVFEHELGSLPEGTLTYAQSSTFDEATTDAYLDRAIERLSEGRDRFELLIREDDPYEIAGTRTMRFRAKATADGVPLEVSVLIIVGLEASLIAQVVHEPSQFEIEKPRVDALFEAIVDAVRDAPTTVA